MLGFRLLLVVVVLFLATPAAGSLPAYAGGEEVSLLQQQRGLAPDGASTQEQLEALQKENAALKEQVTKLKQDMVAKHMPQKPLLSQKSVSVALLESQKKKKKHGHKQMGKAYYRQQYLAKRHKRYYGLDINKVQKGVKGKVVVFGRKGCGRTDLFEEELNANNEASLREGKAKHLIHGVKYTFKDVDDDNDNTELWALAEKYDREISMLPVVWVCDRFLPEFWTFDGIVDQVAEAKVCADNMSEDQAEEETKEVSGEGDDMSNKDKAKAEEKHAGEMDHANAEATMATAPDGCDAKPDAASNCGSMIEMFTKDVFCEMSMGEEYCEKSCFC